MCRITLWDLDEVVDEHGLIQQTPPLVEDEEIEKVDEESVVTEELQLRMVFFASSDDYDEVRIVQRGGADDQGG